MAAAAAFAAAIVLMVAGASSQLSAAVPGPERGSGARLRRAAGLAALGAAVAALIGAIVFATEGSRSQPLTAATPPTPGPPPATGSTATLQDLERPLDVSVDGEGRLYVLEGRGQRRVRVFDSEGALLSTFDVPAAEGGPGVAYLAVGPDGSVYVADRASRSVLVFDAQGALVRRLPAPTADGWLPLGVAFDAAGNLYVTDVTPGRHRVLKLDAGGRLVWAVGSQGTAPGQFSFPTDVAVDGWGRVYVSDTNNSRVQVLDALGRFLQFLPDDGNALGPRGLAVEGRHLYVVASSRHQVLVYDVLAAPTLVSPVLDGGDVALLLSYPSGVASAAGERLYVAERGADRVLVWEP